MNGVERLIRQLRHSRGVCEQLLAPFQSQQDWTRQVHAEANHALWIAGHLALTDNFFLSLLAKEKCRARPDYDRLFGMGSQPSSNPDDYPPPTEVVDYLKERRETLLGVLASLRDDDLTSPAPAGTPDFLPDVGSIFEMAVWHEGLHGGQLSVARRALGHRPIFNPVPA